MATVRYLSGVVSGAARQLITGAECFGYMLTPNIENVVDLSRTYSAADTGCYSASGASTFSLPRYLAWLDQRAAYWSTCLFVNAPDVLGDAAATLQVARPVLPILRRRGWKAALVAQDGIERLRVPWATFDALFLGGSTEWKLSEGARRVTREAVRRGKYVHMGRVNSAKRAKLAASWGCLSLDGTLLRYGPTVNMPRIYAWMTTINGEPPSCQLGTKEPWAHASLSLAS